MGELTFEQIIPSDDQVKVLYHLLQTRRHTISHKVTPDFNDHAAFVRSHPYRLWCLISRDDDTIGSVYVQHDNSVGLNLVSDVTKETVQAVFAYLRDRLAPHPPIPSVRYKDFFINVPLDDTDLAKALTEAGYVATQVSYVKSPR